LTMPILRDNVCAFRDCPHSAIPHQNINMAMTDVATIERAPREKGRAREQIKAAFDYVALGPWARELEVERAAYFEALKLKNARSTGEFKTAVERYQKAFSACADYIRDTEGDDAAQKFVKWEVRRAAGRTIEVRAAHALFAAAGGSLAALYAKLLVIGGGYKATLSFLASVPLGYVTNKTLKDGVDTKLDGKILGRSYHIDLLKPLKRAGLVKDTARAKTRGIGTVNKSLEEKYQKLSAASRASGESYIEFARKNAALIAKRKRSKLYRFATRMAASIVVTVGTADALNGTISNHISQGADWAMHRQFVMEHTGISEKTLDTLANGTGDYPRVMHRLFETVINGGEKTLTFLGNLLGSSFHELVIGPAAAGPFGYSNGFPPPPSTANGVMQGAVTNGWGHPNGGFSQAPSQTNGQFTPGGNSGWPAQNYGGGRYGGGYGRRWGVEIQMGGMGGGGYENLHNNFRVLNNFSGYDSNGYGGYGGYSGESYGPWQWDGHGYWRWENHGEGWVRHEHVETYHHEEVYHHEETRNVTHEVCAPGPGHTEVTRTPIAVVNPEKTLHELGTHPFADTRAEAFDTEHINKVIEQYRTAGKSPEFLKAFKDWLVKEGQLTSWGETTIDSHARFEEMANVYGQGGHTLAHGVAMDSKASYIAEHGSFTYTEADGSVHQVDVFRPEKLEAGHGCNNFAIQESIVSSHTVPGPQVCHTESGQSSDGSYTHAATGAESNMQEMDAMRGLHDISYVNHEGVSERLSFGEVKHILTVLDNPSAHQLLSDRSFMDSHVEALEHEQIPAEAVKALRAYIYTHELGITKGNTDTPLLDLFAQRFGTQ
jgi:hypothetical protein